ncbi:MAG: HEAT repeat domain-containing protein [Thermoguttaceae bacterium]
MPKDISARIRDLIEDTLSPDVRARVVAARELSDLGKDAAPAIPFLVRLLGDKRPYNSCTPNDVAVAALRRLDTLAIPALIDELPRASSLDQEEAITRLLGYYRDKRTVGALIELLNDRNPTIREQAAYALRGTRDPRSVEPLIARLQDSNPRVRRAACWMLGEVGDIRAVEPLIRSLADNSLDVQTAAASALSKVPDLSSLKPLLARLNRPEASLRASAAKALGELRDARVVAPLIKVLQHDPDEGARIGAAVALGKIGDSRAVEPLIVALREDKSKPPSLRIVAAISLGKLHDARAFDVLLSKARVLRPVAYGDDRWWAIFALGQIPDGCTAEPLAAIWHDPKECITARCVAALGLGRTRDRRSIDALAFVLKNGPTPLAQQAIRCLGERRDPEAKDLLEKSLNHPNEGVRRVTKNLLQEREIADEEEWREYRD